MKLQENPTVVVRSSLSGVWIGEGVDLDGDTVRLANAYRIWSWEGALDTTAIAAHGVNGGRVGAVAPTVIVFGCTDIVWSNREAWQTVADRCEEADHA